MAIPALITTVGGATSNSYRSLDEAESYFEARLDGEDWLEETPDRKTQALLRAAKLMNPISWFGHRVNSDQALAWPRVGVIKRDGAGVYTYGYHTSALWPAGEQYLSTEIPEEVGDAQCEYAFALLTGWNTDGEAEVKSFSDDKMSVTYDRQRMTGPIPPEVKRLISGLATFNKLIRG